MSELKKQLDDLWEKYLHLLDQYDQAQRDISTYMSTVCRREGKDRSRFCSR